MYITPAAHLDHFLGPWRDWGAAAAHWRGGVLLLLLLLLLLFRRRSRAPPSPLGCCRRPFCDNHGGAVPLRSRYPAVQHPSSLFSC
jgi:hypothetical protein